MDNTVSHQEWRPIATAPYDCDLELAVRDADGTHALVFPCRRSATGWVKAENANFVNVHPTHWREWRRTIRVSSGRSD